MLPPIDAQSAGQLVGTEALKTFGSLLAKMAISATTAAGLQIWRSVEGVTAGFGKHLGATFDRCTKIKTILNPDGPVNLLSLYVTTHFICGSDVLRDDEVVALARKHKRIVISGTGGGGKTVFMKYLWIALFEDSQGKVPIFLELRRLNDIT